VEIFRLGGSQGLLGTRLFPWEFGGEPGYTKGGGSQNAVYMYLLGIQPHAQLKGDTGESKGEPQSRGKAQLRGAERGGDVFGRPLLNLLTVDKVSF